MAQITINIPNGVVQRTLDAICGKNGYQEEINQGTEDAPDMIPNPQTKAEFAKAWIISVVKHQVKIYESEQAAITARQAQEQAVESEIDIT